MLTETRIFSAQAGKKLITVPTSGCEICERCVVMKLKTGTGQTDGRPSFLFVYVQSRPLLTGCDTVEQKPDLDKGEKCASSPVHWLLEHINTGKARGCTTLSEVQTMCK